VSNHDDGASDLLQWASVPRIGVGGNPVGDLAGSVVAPGNPTLAEYPQPKKSRSRPNRGRKKRTNRSPLAEPPWGILAKLPGGIPPGIENLSYTPLNWRRGPSYSAWKVQVRARYGTVCHLCKHEGATTADHLIPVSMWSNQPYDARLARPAHGVDGCPTCKVKCNSSRGNKELATMIGNYKPPVEL
jgi:hypothetical protein